MFGAETEFMIPVIVMASSLEFGKLMAASFLYRHWKTCPKALRGYLSLAVVVLIGITSIGIYGYLSQAFENTVAMVEGLEEEIASLDKEQEQYDRQVAGYRESSRKNFSVVEKRGEEERLRLQSFIEDRRADIKEAEGRKATDDGPYSAPRVRQGPSAAGQLPPVTILMPLLSDTPFDAEGSRKACWTTITVPPGMAASRVKPPRITVPKSEAWMLIVSRIGKG